jgi:hypothetical protein
MLPDRTTPLERTPNYEHAITAIAKKLKAGETLIVEVLHDEWCERSRPGL